jgi:hypothetical protein
LIRVLIALMFASRIAHADEPPAEAETPWSKDVPEPTRKQAEGLFDQGNEFFAKQAHAPAAEKYRAALLLWDHPLIRYNLAVTLIRLDRPLEASEELEKALRFGDKPFKPELYQQALDYQNLLKKQVGYVEVSCAQAGVAITLDGKRWFDCPGTQKLRVSAGEHTIVGDKPQFVPRTRRIVIAGGAVGAETMKLEPFETQYKLVYPRPRWLPWTITAGGGVIALAGLGVWVAGRSQLDAFQNNFERDCKTGCEKDLSLHQALRDQRDSAELKGTIGVTMMIAGGAAVAGGVVFAILNSPRRVLPRIEANPTAGGMQARVGWQF